MGFCFKAAKYVGMIFGGAAFLMVVLGLIGYIMWYVNGSSFLNVKEYWNFFWISIPFSLISICCTLFMISAKEKDK